MFRNRGCGPVRQHRILSYRKTDGITGLTHQRRIGRLCYTRQGNSPYSHRSQCINDFLIDSIHKIILPLNRFKLITHLSIDSANGNKAPT